MDIPRFDRHDNKGAGADDLGEAFQQFAYELLLFDYPDLHFFQARGIDGAIDLAQTKDGPRCVVECKYVGTDGLAEAQKRWREVADKLRRNLAAAEGPAEKQYEPWYRTDSPVSEYVFCVSSEFKYLGQEDKLQREIAGFFADLSTRHAHLAHLSSLSVTVLDWNDLKARLRKHPHLLLRWFKLTRDYGLKTLDETIDRTTFRSYLYSDKLPYYALRQHLIAAPAPQGEDITDEEGLLSLVAGDRLTGLVLTGAGGVGKTRLTLEMGWLAQSEGWVVLRVLRRLKEDAIEHLAQLVTPETKTLLLIDYVETQRDFDELVNVLNDLNDSAGLRLRYVANCRTSYYKTIAAIARQEKVDISPALEDPEAERWFDGYRRRTVRHILEHSGVEVTEKHLTVCRDIPVFAVFISYLHTKGRRPELESLLEEQDFARWLVKRLQLSGVADVLPRLAQLVALFPMPSTATHHEDLKGYSELFHGLAADGWIEEFPADDEYRAATWRAAHDVLADQILLFHFESIPRTVEHFVRDLLTLARRVGCLRSALFTLQRLVGKPALKALDWPSILDAAINEDPPAWRTARDLLVRTSLLSNLQIINLLGKHEEVWQGAEEDTGFQQAVGWYARWALDQKETQLDESQRSTLQSWLQKSAAHATVNNYVLTSGIKFCPELVRDAALDWIRTHPRLFQTHYLIVAWLEAGLPVDEAAPYVKQWAARFSDSFHLSFIVRAWLGAGGDVEALRIPIITWLAYHKTDTRAQFVYKAWLDAGGDIETVRSSIAAWFAEHATEAEAQFVYKAWLDAGGDIETVKDAVIAWLATHATEAKAEFIYKAWLNAGGDTHAVKDAIAAWLAEHKMDEEASFIYRAWLNAGGDKEVVRESVVAWLDRHGTDADAQFVYQAWLEKGGSFTLIRSQVIHWLSQNCEREEAVFPTKYLTKQADIPVETVKNILKWCRKFPSNEDAFWRLTQLGRHLLNEEVAEEACATSEVILDPLLSPDTDLSPLVRGQIITLFSYFIEAPALRVGELRSRVDRLLLRWLRHPASFGDDPKPHKNVQRRSYVQRIADLVASGALSVSEDRGALERFARWVNGWEPEWKSRLVSVIGFLERNYPAPGVWDIVEFE
jgi:hypothetical protein